MVDSTAGQAGDGVGTTRNCSERTVPSRSRGLVLAVCLCPERGVQKPPVSEIELLVDHGVRGDGHAGDWHRQVSLLADESAAIMREKGLTIGPGDFGENILTRGMEVKRLPLGTRLRVGAQALLEVTQIGKLCHAPCAIGRAAGECIMPTDGIFCRVLEGGIVRPGDEIHVVSNCDSGTE